MYIKNEGSAARCCEVKALMRFYFCRLLWACNCSDWWRLYKNKTWIQICVKNDSGRFSICTFLHWHKIQPLQKTQFYSFYFHVQIWQVFWCLVFCKYVHFRWPLYWNAIKSTHDLDDESFLLTVAAVTRFHQTIAQCCRETGMLTTWWLVMYYILESSREHGVFTSSLWHLCRGQEHENLLLE